ncbi:MAG: ferredoxin family protein [Deltaproteobacteria bacterium]|nr:ferredoxin family protein [Deltaproteobacteria bacterium]
MGKQVYRFRCGIRINYAKCVGCGTCHDICPTDVFGFDSQSRLITVDYPEECWYCGSCIYDCPNNALEMELPLACL